jgi:hypothetical protein
MSLESILYLSHMGLLEKSEFRIKLQGDKK